MYPFYPSVPNQSRPTKPFDMGFHQAVSPNASHQLPVPPFAQQSARGGTHCDPNQIAAQPYQHPIPPFAQQSANCDSNQIAEQSNQHPIPPFAQQNATGGQNRDPNQIAVQPNQLTIHPFAQQNARGGTICDPNQKAVHPNQIPIPPFAQQNARGGTNCDTNQIAVQSNQIPVPPFPQQNARGQNDDSNQIAVQPNKIPVSPFAQQNTRGGISCDPNQIALQRHQQSIPPFLQQNAGGGTNCNKNQMAMQPHQLPVPPFAQQNIRGVANCDPNQIAMQQMQALSTPMFNNPNNPSMQQSMQNQAALMALNAYSNGVNAQLMAQQILMSTVRPFVQQYASNQYPMNLNPLAMMAMQNNFCPIPQNFQGQFNMNGVMPQTFHQNMNQPMMGMLQGQFPSQNPIYPVNTSMLPSHSVPLSSDFTSGALQGNMKSFDTAALSTSSNQNSELPTAIPPNQIRPWHGGQQSQQTRFRNPQSHQKGRFSGRERGSRIPKSNQQILPKRTPQHLKYSEEEVKKWLEARKRNFPTSKNLAAMKVQSNPVLDDEAKLRRKQLKEILNKQAELGVEVAELPPEYVSDGEVVSSCNNSRKKQNKNNKRGKRGRDNRNVNKKQKHKADKKTSLLQKLLKNEIEADKSKLLQVFTFMALNSFFEHFPEKPLEFLQVTVNDNKDQFQKVSREAEIHESDCDEDGQVVEDKKTLISPQGAAAEKSEEGEISESEEGEISS